MANKNPGRELDTATQDERYRSAAGEYGPALARLARAVEADPAERHDLLQEIHFALWRSLAGFDGRCSLRTWVYRVAHNAAASYVTARRRASRGVSIEEMDVADAGAGPEEALGERQTLDRLMAMIHALRPADAQIMLLYLEDIDAAGIGEITGMTAGAVATKIHRLKAVLARRVQGGVDD